MRLGASVEASGTRFSVQSLTAERIWLCLFDAAGDEELDRIALGPTPKAIAMTADGARALVTRFVSGPTEGEVWKKLGDAHQRSRLGPRLAAFLRRYFGWVR